MSTRPALRSALIIENDPTTVASIKSDRDYHRYSPVVVSEGSASWQAIRDPGTAYQAIILSASSTRPGLIPALRAIREHRPATPVYLLYDQSVPFTRTELNRLTIEALFHRPIRLSEMLTTALPSGPAPTLVEAPAAPLPDEGEADGDFYPVAVENFLSNATCAFDVYLRLPSEGYIKVLNAKEQIPVDRVLKYREKGLGHFYLKKEAKMRLLVYCDVLARTLMLRQGVSPEIKFYELARRGEELVTKVRGPELSEAAFEDALSYLDELYLFVTHLKSERREIVLTYLKNVSALEHLVSVSFAVALMAQPLKIESHNLVRHLGLASLLHDIGLSRLPEHLWSEDESKMSEEDRELYRKHPVLGAETLSSLPRIDPIVVQAVAQHHERRNQPGFAMRVSAGDINPIAEVVGICDEYVRRVRSKLPVAQDSDLYSGFSLPVVTAFKSVFGQT